MAALDGDRRHELPRCCSFRRSLCSRCLVLSPGSSVVNDLCCARCGASSCSCSSCTEPVLLPGNRWRREWWADSCAASLWGRGTSALLSP
jgi:hypothetical protein